MIRTTFVDGKPLIIPDAPNKYDLLHQIREHPMCAMLVVTRTHYRVTYPESCNSIDAVCTRAIGDVEALQILLAGMNKLLE